MSAALERAQRLLPALWAGVLLAIALIAAPATFAALPPSEAGRVNGRMFLVEAWLSIGLGLALWIAERRRARQAAELGQGSLFSTEMVLLVAVLFSTVAGYFAVQQMLPAARSGQGVLGFGALHTISVAFYGIKAALVSILAWRRAAG